MWSKLGIVGNIILRANFSAWDCRGWYKWRLACPNEHNKINHSFLYVYLQVRRIFFAYLTTAGRKQ